MDCYKKLAFLVRNERYCSNGDGDKASNIRKYYISEITLDHIIFPQKKEHNIFISKNDTNDKRKPLTNTLLLCTELSRIQERKKNHMTKINAIDWLK